MKRQAVALIDGEHYPPVVVDALQKAGDRFEFRAALFLGGAEKIKEGDLEGMAESVYGLPVVFDSDWRRGLSRVIDRFAPEVVVDLSDEPVLGYEQRFRLISQSLARNVGYVGSDFHFSPASSDRLCTSPSLSIVGTAKRVGKTAISGYVSRVIQQVVCGAGAYPGVVVVAMGRGGPAEPEVIDGTRVGLTAQDLLAWSRQGRHAASDHFEDAVLSRLVTVGCRRCGGGMAGEPFVSNVAAGARVANSLSPSLVVFEGSGAALPPVGTDARLLVAGAQQPVEHIAGYLGAYRLLTSDALVLTMAEEPLASVEKVRAVIAAVGEVRPGLTTVPVVFRPRPAEPLEGKRVAFFSTAPPSQEGTLSRYLEERWGCRVDLFSGNLSDRAALRTDLQRPEMAGVDTVLTEIKAAAIDVLAEEATARGLEVVFVDNHPVEVSPGRAGGLAELAQELAELAKERFETRT
jgi:cyclic 2,3-diphosphoglycerate synthetase